MSDSIISHEFETLPKMIRVRLPDRRDGEGVRSARVYNYIPEPECETDETGFVTRVRLDGFWYVPAIGERKEVDG